MQKSFFKAAPISKKQVYSVNIKFILLTKCPHQEEQSPEVILNCCRIFSVKFEDVLDNDCEVNEQNNLQGKYVLDEKLKIAQNLRKRSIPITNQSGNLKNSLLSFGFPLEKKTYRSIQLKTQKSFFCK